MPNAAEKERAEEVRFLGEHATPRDERSRSSLGELEMSIQTLPGLCGKPRAGKGACWRKANHEGRCP
jgi:hypothetical protein